MRGRSLHTAFFALATIAPMAARAQTPSAVLSKDEITLLAKVQVAIDVASLAPNAEITVYPWKDPPELKARTINRVRKFLKAHQPMTAAR